MQHSLISTILEQLELHTTEAIPSIYKMIRQGILRFCEDVRGGRAAKRLQGAVQSCNWHILTIADSQGKEKSLSLEKIRKAS